MQSSIKNLQRILGFVLILIIPFWVSRIVLFSMDNSLVIHSWLDYLLYATRFDLKTMAIWYSPLFIVSGSNLFFKNKFIHWLSVFLFILLSLSALVFGLIAAFYFPTSKSILGTELFQLIQGQEPTILWGYAIAYWPGIILAIVFTFGLYKLYSLTRIEISGIKRIFFCLTSLLLLVFLARGGFKLKPLNSLDAYSNLSAEEATTAINPVYVLLESYGKNEIEYIAYFDEETLKGALASDVKIYKNTNTNKPNICLILLESFGKEYTGDNLGNRQSYTPFLDSLARQSIYYSNAYANGLKSMDAVASVLAGMPALMKQPLIGSLYTQKDFESVPEALHNQGYYSSFFHGADEQSMGFRPFLYAQGLDAYYGRQQYPDLKMFDGTWGIFDGPFLQFVNTKMSEQRSPWFSTVFTLSSHHPYTVPSEYSYLRDGTLPIHKAVGYTDEALRLFFENAKTQPWFQNTIFIITADHTSINETKTYKSYRGKYEVPLLIYAPEILSPDKVDRPVQHIDISTTIKAFAGVPQQVAAGASLLDSVSSHITHYDGNVFVYTTDSFTLEWSGGNNLKLYNYIVDRKQIHNLASENMMKSKSMLDSLKLSLQKYNYRMVNNFF
ncbi:MAG: sulfatase-like hydrolase/transferase [Bacteroidia bacterium]